MIVQGPSSAAYRRPLSGSVDQCQDPYGPAIDLVDKAIAFVRDQFAGSRDPPWPADQGVTGPPGCSTAEQAIHPGRGPRAADRDVLPDCYAVLLRAGRPDDFHRLVGPPARRDTKSGSPSSCRASQPLLGHECVLTFNLSWY